MFIVDGIKAPLIIQWENNMQRKVAIVRDKLNTKKKRSSQNISRSVRRAITVASNSKLQSTEHSRMGLQAERTHGTRVP
jgi:hypothetical protein